MQILKSLLATLIFTALLCQGRGQSLAVNTTGAAADASALVDITSATKGLLIPRVALTATNTAGPIAAPLNSLLVYNTATAATGTANAVTPGYYYWSGTAWTRVTDNGWKIGTSAATTNAIGAAASIGYLGTSTNSHIDLVSNGQVRGRLTNTGSLLFGATTSYYAEDLTESITTPTFSWALNGICITDFGGGIFGEIRSGINSNYSGIQGEYNGTNARGNGVRGMYNSTTVGTNFGILALGVSGIATSTGTYKFGVGGTGGSSLRSGGVLGNNYGNAGALGYYASNSTNYSVYGFGDAYTPGGAGGRPAINGDNIVNDQKPDTNTHIGLGIYGGVMGGWVRGLKYGFNTKGETYSLYIDGKGYTNEPLVYLMPTETNERVAGYMVTSLQPEVNIRGRTNLVEGRAFVAFDEKFSNVITGKADEMMIIATPQGKTNGVYVDSISADGFWITENNDGHSNTPVVWMATGTVKTQRPVIAPELLNRNFDVKMNGVMFNENNNKDKPQSIWWDGEQIRWDTPPPKIPSNEHLKYAKPKNL